ncbi:O-antigen ligase family protein [Candidatus Pelagibacter sp.]|nr:O-antigen ligase family protein [Candidatus Pelagibacter sp.]MDC1496984.1 O-antigen ligase family protein [Pelagibacteraceae bacterium]
MSKIDKKKFIIFLNLIIITLILDIFFQFYFKIDFFGYRLEDFENTNMDRISGFFGNELIAGTYLSLFGFLTLFLTKEFNFFVKNNYIFFIYLILLISAAIITGDRVVILFIFGIIFFNFIFNYHMRKHFLIVFLIFGLIGTTIIKNVDKLSDRYIDKFDPVKEAKLSTSSPLKGIINSPWISHYLVSWEMIKEKPFLGFGIRGFRTYCNQYIDREKLSSYKRKCTSHPHNTYFEILVETGTIGLVIFILINLNILIKVLKKKDQTIYLVYSIIFTILNPLRPSGSFFTTWNGGIFWTILGILLYFIIYNKNYIKNQSDNRH